jgi:hypothetical protein
MDNVIVNSSIVFPPAIKGANGVDLSIALFSADRIDKMSTGSCGVSPATKSMKTTDSGNMLSPAIQRAKISVAELLDRTMKCTIMPRSSSGAVSSTLLVKGAAVQSSLILQYSNLCA